MSCKTSATEKIHTGLNVGLTPMRPMLGPCSDLKKRRHIGHGECKTWIVIFETGILQVTA